MHPVMPLPSWSILAMGTPAGCLSKPRRDRAGRPGLRFLWRFGDVERRLVDSRLEVERLPQLTKVMPVANVDAITAPVLGLSSLEVTVPAAVSISRTRTGL